MLSTRLRVRASKAALALSLATLAPSALADPLSPEATPSTPHGPDTADPNLAPRSRYNAGARAFAQGRFVEAALDFEAAAGQQLNPIALYTAALSWEKANVPDRAADQYARAIAAGGLPPEQAAIASQRLASLESVLGAVSVAATEGSRVQLDSNTEVPAPATLHGTAGVHVLFVRASARPIQRLTVVLTRGTTTRANVEGVPAPLPPPPPPLTVATRATPVRRTLGFVVLGAAGVALVAGGVLGVEALAARDANNSAPTRASYDHALSLASWADVAFVAGGVLAAGGLALVLWPASPKTAANAQRDGGVLFIDATWRGIWVKGYL
jgi:hypothetical protein